MAIGYRSQTDNGTFSATSIVLTKPAGTADGDVLLFAVCVDTLLAVDYTTPGFTELYNDTSGSSGFSMAYRVCGGSEPADYTFTFTSGTEAGVASLLCYSGCEPSDPIDSQSLVEAVAPGAGVPHITTLLTPTVDNCMLVGAIFRDPAATPSFTAVTGYDLRVQLARNAAGALGVADKLQSTATNEGVQITENEGSTWGELTIALNPLVAGGGMLRRHPGMNGGMQDMTGGLNG